MSRPLLGVYPEGIGRETVWIDGVRTDPAVLRRGLEQAADLGSELTVEPLAWGVVQPRLGVYDWTQQDWWDQAVSGLSRPPVRTYSLWITHMWRRGLLPAELVDEPFDSPLFLQSFEAFVEAAAARCGWHEEPPVVLVANEIDLFTDAEPEQTEALLRFLPAAADVLRRVVPGARVTNTVTYSVVAKPGGKELARRAQDGCDIFGFNWYDITSSFPTLLAERTPAAQVFDDMAVLADGRPLFLQETGLPAAPECRSSDEIQAAFVDELFDALAERSGEQVWGCLWFLLHDFSHEVIHHWLTSERPVLNDEPEFIAFLTSLGVCTVDGTPRPAYQRLKDRLARPSKA
jgi:hypothetical protein